MHLPALLPGLNPAAARAGPPAAGTVQREDGLLYSEYGCVYRSSRGASGVGEPDRNVLQEADARWRRRHPPPPHRAVPSGAVAPGPRRATGLVNPTGLVGLQAPETSLPKPSAATLGDIEHKVYAGERLSAEDGLALYACDDLPWLGQLARFVQRRKSGDHVYFNINRHIKLTNICKAYCHFCSLPTQRRQGGRLYDDPR